jgi:hypothetical protein
MQKKAEDDSMYYVENQRQLKETIQTLEVDIAELNQHIQSEKSLSEQTLEVFKKDAAEAQNQIRRELHETQSELLKMKDNQFLHEEQLDKKQAEILELEKELQKV